VRATTLYPTEIESINKDYQITVTLDPAKNSFEFNERKTSEQGSVDSDGAGFSKEFFSGKSTSKEFSFSIGGVSKTDEGISAAATLAADQPGIGVVLLSQHVEADYAVRFLEHGSARRAYLLKERVGDARELVAAITTVAAGGSVIDPMVVEQLVQARNARPDSALDRLSPREREVLEQMALGKNNAAIAATLFLTERAVEKHTNAIFGKLGFAEEPDLNRRVAAVLMFLQKA